MAQELRDSNEWKTEFGKDETKIVWEVKANPKRPNFKAHARFEQYFGTETVGEYLKAGGSRGDLKYDWEHHYLTLDAPEASPEKKEVEVKTIEPVVKGKVDKKVETRNSSRKDSAKVIDKELLS